MCRYFIYGQRQFLELSWSVRTHRRGRSAKGLLAAANWEMRGTTARKEAETFPGDKKKVRPPWRPLNMMHLFSLPSRACFCLCSEDARASPPLGPQLRPRAPLSRGKVWIEGRTWPLELWARTGTECHTGQTAAVKSWLLGFCITTLPPAELPPGQGLMDPGSQKRGK